jgi:hypothetical protein
VPVADPLEVFKADPSSGVFDLRNEFLTSTGSGPLALERRADPARLRFRALLAGTLANFLSACIAGILL